MLHGTIRRADRTARSLGIASAALLAAFFPQIARAEAPVNRCVDSGQAPLSAAAGGGEDGFSSWPKLRAPQAAAGAPNLGTVSTKTGAFTFAVEDLALGAGEFPAKLALVRTYSSEQDGPNGVSADGMAPYEPGSRQPTPFGRGATHNLDITYEDTMESFSGSVFPVVAIKMGFQTSLFQKCANGVFMSSRGDGSRLYADSTYPNGGYRYESRSGDILLFQKISTSGTYHCAKRMMYGNCGVLRRWTAANGDWAQFDYQEYYNHPTSRAEPSFMGYLIHMLFNTTVQECHANFAGANECHSVIYPTNYSTNESGLSGINSLPVYAWRPTKVSNSRGYELRFQYVDSTIDVGGLCSSDLNGSFICSPAKNAGLPRGRVQSVTGHWTSPAGQSTQLAQTSYGYGNCWGLASDCLTTAQAADGAITTYAYSYTQASSTLAITPPGYAAPVTTLNFAKAVAGHYYPDYPRGYYLPQKQFQYYLRVDLQSFADGSSIQYNPTYSNKWVAEATGTWDWAPFVASMQIVAPGNAVTTYNYVDQTDDHDGPVTVVNPLGATTANLYDGAGALLKATEPEGNRLEFAYDVRGNILSTTRFRKPGSGLAALAEVFAYSIGPTTDANACPNQKLCNRAVSRVDARSFQTDYVWDAATGLLASETAPARADGMRPATSYGYGSLSGAGGTTVWLPTTMTQRIDSTRNLVTTLGYDADIRLAVRESTVTGDGVTLRHCYKFDMKGDLVSETRPRAALGSCP